MNLSNLISTSFYGIVLKFVSKVIEILLQWIRNPFLHSRVECASYGMQRNGKCFVLQLRPYQSINMPVEICDTVQIEHYKSVNC